MKILMTIFSCRNENISIAVAERRRHRRCCRRCPCAWLRLLHGKSEQQQQQLHPQTKRMKSIQVNAFLLCYPLSLSSLSLSLTLSFSLHFYLHNNRNCHYCCCSCFGLLLQLQHISLSRLLLLLVPLIVAADFATATADVAAVVAVVVVVADNHEHFPLADVRTAKLFHDFNLLTTNRGGN